MDWIRVDIISSHSLIERSGRLIGERTKKSSHTGNIISTTIFSITSIISIGSLNEGRIDLVPLSAITDHSVLGRNRKGNIEHSHTLLIHWKTIDIHVVRFPDSNSDLEEWEYCNYSSSLDQPVLPPIRHTLQVVLSLHYSRRQLLPWISESSSYRSNGGYFQRWLTYDNGIWRSISPSASIPFPYLLVSPLANTSTLSVPVASIAIPVITVAFVGWTRSCWSMYLPSIPTERTNHSMEWTRNMR